MLLPSLPCCSKFLNPARRPINGLTNCSNIGSEPDSDFPCHLISVFLRLNGLLLRSPLVGIGATSYLLTWQSGPEQRGLPGWSGTVHL